jgi:hypothetical protein
MKLQGSLAVDPADADRFTYAWGKTLNPATVKCASKVNAD